MYAKIESERLWYIKYNQAKLRFEEYIYLRDAFVGNVDETTNINDIGIAYILDFIYSELFFFFYCNPAATSYS